ncbi:4-hydroxy-tetrahydrodipicolinate reductase [unidentified bacterial endosymbiont]|uniref:4-hydroxy-tetrahydrodipicolinate reductase n=1 Tax=unidentified bacterial endosymbiont TaxID=2355 RepID=UPI0020A1A3D6|nr:4-hydroxy-tetrahydrodipicolinate reductase [unidentified bacterial endosymbiont]
MCSPVPIGVAIAGASGRLGRALIQVLQQSTTARLQGALVSPNSPWAGQDAGKLVGVEPLGVILTTNVSEALFKAAVLIDFTTPSATLHHLERCRQQGKAMVIGTTGLEDNAQRLIAQTAQQIAVLQSANFSLGVQLLYQLAASAARVLGTESDIDIIDQHHRHKRDAPSGTALALGERLANTLGLEWPGCLDTVPPGRSTGRAAGKIQFASVRSGETVGEHRVSFTLADEQLSITHQAMSRLAFAKGAVRAAQWLVHQPAAHYTLQDLLEQSVSQGSS